MLIWTLFCAPKILVCLLLKFHFISPPPVPLLQAPHLALMLPSWTVVPTGPMGPPPLSPNLPPWCDCEGGWWPIQSSHWSLWTSQHFQSKSPQLPDGRQCRIANIDEFGSNKRKMERGRGCVQNIFFFHQPHYQVTLHSLCRLSTGCFS